MAVGVILVSLALPAVTSVGCARLFEKRDVAYHPVVDPANFQTTVDNPFFPLVPGTVYRYTEVAKDQRFDNDVTVTHDTKVILGVTCTVVHDVVKLKDVVQEDTLDWYAQDKQGTVWYFGEDTKEYLSDGSFSTEGSWEAGVGGAQPGIVMPARPQPGEPYRQEYSYGHAEDMGQIIDVHASITVPAGSYDGCVKTKDWSLLEVGSEFKWYARGVGLVRAEAAHSDVAELVSVTKP